MKVGEWRKCELGDVIELKRGYDLPSRLRTGGEFPLISSSGRSDTHDQSKVSGPGVVTGRYGTIGQVFYIEEDFWPLNTTLYVRDFKGNNPRFIYYFLQGLNWESFNDKSGVPGVNRNDVHRAIVSIADQDTQKAIVGVLSSIDDKIELNRRTNETLEAMAQA
ncbi:restriction endonuclease subunit S, partial [Hyphomonas sp. UBA2515]